MTGEQVIQLIKDKQAYYESSYKEYVEQNPGYIMSGLPIMARACQEILQDIDKILNPTEGSNDIPAEM